MGSSKSKEDNNTEVEWVSLGDFHTIEPKCFNAIILSDNMENPWRQLNGDIRLLDFGYYQTKTFKPVIDKLKLNGYAFAYKTVSHRWHAELYIASKNVDFSKHKIACIISDEDFEMLTEQLEEERKQLRSKISNLIAQPPPYNPDAADQNSVNKQTHEIASPDKSV